MLRTFLYNQPKKKKKSSVNLKLLIEKNFQNKTIKYSTLLYSVLRS